MYSISGRLNTIGYNMMIGMIFMGALNYLDCYFGPHELKDLSFEMTNMDLFIKDKYLKEDVASF